jgi:hypothetical protein
LISYAGSPRPDVGYKAVEVALMPAAVVDVSDWLSERRTGDSLFMYAGSSVDGLATAFPAVAYRKKVVVPARTPVTPIMFRAGRPFRLGATMVLENGETRRAPLPGRHPGLADVVFDTKLDRVVGERVEHFDMPPPDFVLRTSSGETHEPLFVLSNPVALVFSLVIFRDVPVGRAVLTVSGKDWEPVRASVLVEAPLTVAESLTLAPAGRLTIAMTEPSRVSKEITVARCQDLTSDRGPCTLVTRQRIAPGDHPSEVQFTSLPTGRYEIRVDGKDSACWPAQIWPGRESIIIAK